MKAREAAARTLFAVIEQRQSLNQLLPAFKNQLPDIDRALYQELVYGTLREYRSLSFLHNRLLHQPLDKNPLPAIVLNLGIYQLLRLTLGDHGVVHETVELCKKLRCPAVSGLTNAVLRRVQRERSACLQILEENKARNIPAWLLPAYQKDGDVDAFIMRPPMTVRVRLPQTATQWIAQHGANARLNPLHQQAVTFNQAIGVEDLPDFASGGVSVQDAMAQWAATLLQPRAGERILDACAAPGGKTGHLLELAPQCTLIALDHAADRLERVQENLKRLHLNAHCQTADAADLASWYDGHAFDAILLDAPCSGSGVIRRHPDIAWLRSDSDLKQLPKTQYRLLDTLWQTLKIGGRLLYTTCSILPRENQQLIEQFLYTHREAQLRPITLPKGLDTGHGWLHYPDADGDGFFYALLEKRER